MQTSTIGIVYVVIMSFLLYVALMIDLYETPAGAIAMVVIWGICTV